MKIHKILISLICFLLVVSISRAQDNEAIISSKEVLEKGRKIKDSESIFMTYGEEGTNRVLRYQFFEKGSAIINLSTDHRKVKDDKIIFLVSKKKGGLDFFLQPLNPLNYNYGVNLEFKEDPINKAAEEALQEIIGVIKSLSPDDEKEGFNQDCFDLLKEMNTKSEEIFDLLNLDQKNKITTIFKDLKNLKFTTELSTLTGINSAKTKKDIVENHFKGIEVHINELKEQAKNYIKNSSCKEDGKFSEWHYIKFYIIPEFDKNLKAQRIRLKNLDKAYDLVHETYKSAMAKPGIKDYWAFKKDVTMEDGKVAILTIKINKGGSKLDDDNEIVSDKLVEEKQVVVVIRKFQRFVPEISAGIAYTFFKYPTYGTVTDGGTGKQTVDEASEEEINNLKFNTMINFVFFDSETPITPLWQLGLGINTEIPTIMTGLGLRINAGGTRLAITGGIAFTWIKDLDALTVGDEISGTKDIEDDLKFQFASPKPYLGLQFNF